MEECEIYPSELKVLFRETIVSRRDDLDEVIQRIMRTVESFPCAQGNLDKIHLALSEVLANAVIHGNREDPRKKVDICGTCDGHDHLLLVVTDEGQGFDPSSLPDPTTAENIYSTHGRGVFMLNRLMDHVEYRLGGRQVVLRKKCAAARNPMA